jgi:FixJ family two-component response regulator
MSHLEVISEGSRLWHYIRETTLGHQRFASACPSYWTCLLNNAPLISIVDDDGVIRGAIESLVMSYGFLTRTFASAEAFLQSGQLTETSCLISDVQMPNISGVELQQRLADQGLCIPMIFITAYPDDAIRARVLSAGAVGYLQKPFDQQSLMQCVGDALQRRGGEIASD